MQLDLIRLPLFVLIVTLCVYRTKNMLYFYPNSDHLAKLPGAKFHYSGSHFKKWNYLFIGHEER